MNRRTRTLITAVAATTLVVLAAPLPASASVARPVARIDIGARLGPGVPLVITWSHSYCAVLQHKMGAGGWTSIATADASSPSDTRIAVQTRVVHQFRTVDGGCDGTPTTTVFGPRFIPRVQDNGSGGSFPPVAQQPIVVTGSRYFGGSTMQFPGCAANYQQTLTGYGFAWVHSGGPWDGIVDIFVDDAFAGVVSVEASARYYRHVGFGTSSGNRVETHTVFGSGDGDDLCDLDAVIVLRPAT